MLPELDDPAENIIRFSSSFKSKGHKRRRIRDREQDQRCDDQGQRAVDRVSDLLVEMGPAAMTVERLLIGEGGGTLRQPTLLTANYADGGVVRLAGEICVFARRQSRGLWKVQRFGGSYKPLLEEFGLAPSRA